MRSIRYLIGLFLYAFLLNSFAQSVDRVILITLDGVRVQEALASTKYFPKLWQRVEDNKNAHVYGMPGSEKLMETAAIPISQPSYFSIMSGNVQACSNNNCGRIQEETIFDYLRQQGLRKEDAVVFASWHTINKTASKYDSLVYANAGQTPVTKLNDNELGIEFALTNFEQAHHQGVLTTDRLDRYTYAHSIHYLEKFQPRLIWMSFNDPDEFAHEAKWKAYENSLNYCDLVIEAIFKKLEQLNILDSTAVIITTDHGRGDGLLWTSHGPHIPESKKTWAFTFNTKLQPITVEGANEYYNTLSIRPTIESIL